jgi:hypothetical protein
MRNNQPITRREYPFPAGQVLVSVTDRGSMSFRVESNTVTGASPARTDWPAGA